MQPCTPVSRRDAGPTWESSDNSSFCRSTPAFSSMSSMALINSTASCLPLGFLNAEYAHTFLLEIPHRHSGFFLPSDWNYRFQLLCWSKLSSICDDDYFKIWTHSDGKTRSFRSSSISCTVNGLGNTNLSYFYFILADIMFSCIMNTGG